MIDLLWLLAIPLALVVDWALDEDTRSAAVARWRARPPSIERRPSRLVASTPADLTGDTEAHRAMLKKGLRSARTRWEENMEGGYMALARGDEKTIASIRSELCKLPPEPSPSEIPRSPDPVARVGDSYITSGELSRAGRLIAGIDETPPPAPPPRHR